MLAVVCPGQGAQSPQMLRPWLDLPGAAQWFGRASDATGVDLVAHGTVSDEQTIRDTAVAQPLLVATALASARAVLDDFTTDIWPMTSADVTAGHSVGELAAAALAGLLDESEALRLVAVRGAAMAEAARTAAPTGMSAVVGGDTEQVLTR
ncbi:MAG: acyltransferase domain-containing protein, partial [Micrococcales bacterium]|nr:acyltransferase domain-containing protein [Micrococcales bacterium]